MTEWGEILEASPVIYQRTEKNKLLINGEFKFHSENMIGFNLNSDYDHTLPLIIDPTLSYSTYLGGGSVDVGNGIAVDSDGNAYIVGKTSSTDFPTLNQYQGDQTTYDAFVTKLSSDGSTPIYSTYLGAAEVMMKLLMLPLMSMEMLISPVIPAQQITQLKTNIKPINLEPMLLSPNLTVVEMDSFTVHTLAVMVTISAAQ